MTRRLAAAAVVCVCAFVSSVVFGAPASAQGDRGLDDPEIAVWLQAAGGDAIDVYLPSSVGRFGTSAYDLADEIGDAIGPTLDREVSLDYEFEPNSVSVQFDGRLGVRSGGDVRFELDTAELSDVLREREFGGYYLTVCSPDITTDDASTRPGDLADDPYDLPGVDCRGWYHFVNDPMTVSITMHGSVDDYIALAGALVGTALLGSLLAFGLAMLLRRTTVRLLGVAAFVLIAAGVVAAVLPVVVGLPLLGAWSAPVASLVIAADLGVAHQVVLTFAPIIVLAAPGAVFSTAMAATPPAPYSPPSSGPAPFSPYGYGQPQPPPVSSSGPGLPTWLGEDNR